MRDPRLLEEQKKSSRPVLTENIGVEQKKKRKRSSLFVMKPLILYEAVGFSRLSLLVNPALHVTIS